MEIGATVKPVVARRQSTAWDMMSPYQRLGIGLGFCSSLVTAAGAAGQEMPRPPNLERVRIHAGPVLVNPTLAVPNAGIDTNVFNEPDSAERDKDFTITITPAADIWMRMGRSWVVSNIKEDLVWYNKFDSERSANGNISASLLLPFNRLTAAVGGNWIDTRERPGFEIDTRAARTERAVNGIAEIRAGSKTFFGARTERRSIEFDEGETYQGSDLSVELNRTLTTAGATVRNQLTPLTSITFAVGFEQERFDFSPLRDSDSTRFDVGLNFEPFALISGSARFGIRDFRPLSSDVPGYTGSTAAVNLSYTALGTTRLSLGVIRDVQYSYDVNQPYYLQTGFTAGIGQQIYGPVDVEFRLGFDRLSYADREGADVAVTDRVDHVRNYGGGMGYRLGPDLRLGFNVDHARRESELPSHQYTGLRYGFTMTYGL
jgi:Putative beta-barrel porin 2